MFPMTSHCLQECPAESLPLRMRWQSWAFSAQMTALEEALVMHLPCMALCRGAP